jgi:hypothetical protein
MGLLDVFKKPEPSISQVDAEKTVYRHRIDELRKYFAYTKLPQEDIDAQTYTFLREFYSKFFGMTANTPMEAIGQIQASKTSDQAKAAAIELYKQYSQFENMKITAGNAQLNKFLLACSNILDSL